MRALVPGKDTDEINDMFAEYWQRGERQLAAHYLLASLGLEHEGNFAAELDQEKVMFLDELQSASLEDFQ